MGWVETEGRALREELLELSVGGEEQSEEEDEQTSCMADTVCGQPKDRRIEGQRGR